LPNILDMSDGSFPMSSNAMEMHHKQAEPWEVTLVDTGSTTLTSGRLKRVQLFMASYWWELTR
jgi:glucose-1-phosphate cytidylyltransferase